MVDVSTPGLSRCSRCKRHAGGVLWLVMDARGNGEITCNDPACIRDIRDRLVDPWAQPYAKVKCLPDCDHPPVLAR